MGGECGGNGMGLDAGQGSGWCWEDEEGLKDGGG